ncbi:peptide-methionine (S)-S-oxide reductase MsrA [Chondrinema litorale]|uniref:peptide-methionine (S)-S-oxide reductase MsrA n=1 Tax=Chondrinema litorale TaxID=2994555 RepID=UPI002542B7F5|nr:peptide-methionine (S)-S-oxide reductase MsrA [Chondrinema litorale]UZR97882.1 peptide-methionine (S)-S-oxide reductase MsrA [Chondrinema litorale]
MRNLLIAYIAALIFLIPACSQGQKASKLKAEDHEVMKVKDYTKNKDFEGLETATFAGGCFWCTEASFERIKGVKDVISGYSGGEKAYPTYGEVSTKQTKHAESIQIFYDPNEVSYETLLKVFFVAHNPTQLNRQGPDVGEQYRSEIFYHNAEQKEQAKAVIKELDGSGKFDKKIVTKVTPYRQFWVAEGYHQNYYELNPNQPYVSSVSRPKVEKVMKTFPELVKDEYKM